MNTELVNAVTAADDKAQYDACAKRLVAQKMILAHILVQTVDEFKGMSLEEVAACIEGEPRIGIVPIEPGMTNRVMKVLDTVEADGQMGEQIRGLNTEDSEINEGMIRFDIIFYVRMKDGLAQIIINIEIQKDKPGEYKLLNRSICYVSRMVSSQKGRDFINSNYDDMKRVFSIWICLNMNENSLDRYYLENEKLLGDCHWEGKQDLLNIVLIGIAKELPPRDERYELHRLLGTLLSDRLKVQEKIAIIENEHQIPVNDDLRKDVNTMCNLGEGIEERATERTTEQIIFNMYENHFTLEQISLATKMNIEKVKEIIEREMVTV